MKKRLLAVLAAITIAGSMLSGVAAENIPSSMLKGAAAEKIPVNFGIQGGKAGLKRAGRTGVVEIGVEGTVEADVALLDKDGSTLAAGVKKKGTTNTYVLDAEKELAGLELKIVVTPKVGEARVESSETVRFPKR